jgi:murein DD-endopeptidase MepM/ murein hydrolase activator NlpD
MDRALHGARTMRAAWREARDGAAHWIRPTVAIVATGLTCALAAVAAAGYATAGREVGHVHGGPWGALVCGGAQPGNAAAPEVPLPPETERRRFRSEHVRAAAVIGVNVATSLDEAGLHPADALLPLLEAALRSRRPVLRLYPGVRLRVVATRQNDGASVSWSSLDAVEYSAPGSCERVRFYHSPGGPRSPDGAWREQDYRSSRRPWRLPISSARITSRFDLHRLHPVLHVVTPHRGVDFAAPVGTPVHAAASGVVTHLGPSGPCGNGVIVDHQGRTSSVYCHLSRFEARLRVGDRVDSGRVIGYVGRTGRATGPHLHFAIVRNGAFMDPMLMLAQASSRSGDLLLAELDSTLDSIDSPQGQEVPCAAGADDVAQDRTSTGRPAQRQVREHRPPADRPRPSDTR